MFREAPIDAVHSAVDRRRVVADGPDDFNPLWLQGHGRVAFPVESGRHLESDDSRRLAQALRNCSVTELLAIVNDPLVVEDLAYLLDASADDLNQFADEMSGMNALLLPREGVDFAILFSTNDFHMIAGSRTLVQDYVGDLGAAKSGFEQFAANHFDSVRGALMNAAAHASWVDGA